MKSKLLLVCVTIVAGAACWVGCGGDSTNGTTANPDAGGTPEGGGTPDTGTPDSSSGGLDAAKDTGTDAPVTGPFVTITYGAATCPAFTPCGGDPKGSWTVTGGCVTEEIFAPAKQQCPGIVESKVKIEARGTVVANAATITRKTEVKFAATLAIPKVCKDQIGPCATVSQALIFGGVKTAVCTDDAVTLGCNCDVTNPAVDNTSDAYTTAGNTLTTGAPPRTFDYCVAGNEIKYKETTAGTAIPALFVLTK